VGPVFVSTDPKDPDHGVVRLRAVIQDISSVPGDPACDGEEGNITQATVTFIDRDSKQIIAAGLPVERIDADIGTGAVSFDWDVTLSRNDTAQSYTIGIVVEGFYGRDHGSEDDVVTVARPDGDFITGGGYLINRESFGAHGGADGLKTNFGFNVKFNKKMTNLQGHFNAIVRRDDGAGGIQVLQIKSNASESLGIDPSFGWATFVSKSNLTDITDPLNPTEVSGNLSLIVTLTDNGEPGTDDSIGFTLWNGNELWFSSHWNGAETVEQVLDGGNLAVHAGKALLAADGVIDAGQGMPQALTVEALGPVVAEAIARWGASGFDCHGIGALEEVECGIADLEGATLGLAWGSTVWIDSDAAGHGWFVDRTPADDGEFAVDEAGELAGRSGGAPGRMDLLTVVMHEMGHVLGFDDLDGEGGSGELMSSTLESGVRRLPGDVGAAPAGFANGDGLRSEPTGGRIDPGPGTMTVRAGVAKGEKQACESRPKQSVGHRTVWGSMIGLPHVSPGRGRFRGSGLRIFPGEAKEAAARPLSLARGMGGTLRNTVLDDEEGLWNDGRAGLLTGVGAWRGPALL
jgi:hypothetical protein